VATSTRAVSAAAGIVRQVCPRCREGRIFPRPVYRAPLTVFDTCSVCGLKYEREPGYFLGAMYVSYLASIPPVVLLVLAIWKINGRLTDVGLGVAFLAYLPFVPIVARLARVVWMYVDQAFDPR
jgi:uncharacterized protein (DUF983 family)